ncbi:MAG: hypothetical protein KHX91_02125 [Clostridium sp.]|nr:hypothetical protein [Clostridium sp.]
MKIEQHPLFLDQTHQANRDFLYHAVDIYYQMKSLMSGNGTIELCNQLFGGVQVYKGIEQLALAAGKSPKTNWSGNEEYPFEIAFEFCGVRFYQLKEAKE